MTRSARFFAAILCTATIVWASVATAVTIPTVPVGNAGNGNDTTGFGAVSYDYRIGTTEVTVGQYTEFLNAVADTDTYALYNTSMGSDTRGGITRTGSSGSYVYAVKADAIGQGPGGSDYTYTAKPVVFVSWYDTLRFANWMHNNQPSGLQDASTTEDGAYTFGGATSVGARNSGAVWFLTSEDEWYKAAYYDGSTYYDYPTGTDTTPDNNLPTSDSGNSANFYDGAYTTGSVFYPMTDAGAYTLSGSPYGTYDQGGNVWEWNEALFGVSDRIFRGGSWQQGSSDLQSSDSLFGDPTDEFDVMGFRVATVPEPSSLAMAALGLAAGLFSLRRRAGR